MSSRWCVARTTTVTRGGLNWCTTTAQALTDSGRQTRPADHRRSLCPHRLRDRVVCSPSLTCRSARQAHRLAFSRKRQPPKITNVFDILITSRFLGVLTPSAAISTYLQDRSSDALFSLEPALRTVAADFPDRRSEPDEYCSISETSQSAAMFERTWMPPALSETLAAVTSTARRRPSVSTPMCRLRPAIFLPSSMPWLAAGTLAEVLVLWASRTQALGSASRPSASRTRRRRRPLSWSKTSSPCQATK